MFFLYDTLKDQNLMNFTANSTLVDTIKIANGIFDHLNLLEQITNSTTIPTEWTDQTLLNVTFNNSINGGQISEFIGNISRLDIQRKEFGTNEWITIQSLYKDNIGHISTEFTMYDTYEKNNTLYTYQIVPVDAQGNQGTAIQQDVLSVFNDAYIADANNIYKITYEYNLGSIQKNQTNAIYTPYGAKYPTIVYNSINRYDSGSITAILLAPTSQNETMAYLDRNAQVKLVEEFNTWLANGKAKILKDFNGNLKVITIINPVSNNYYKELGNGLASTSFNFVEVGDFSQQYLDKLGMTNKFNIMTKTNQ
nr:MAG TPA: hypothetical protein [Caudoviricetes sp.]